METNPGNKVFIVDDSPSIRARLAEMLSRIDNVRIVGEAASARDAVAGILRTRPDAVLLDLNLFGRTGLDVMRSVHPQEPAIVFVVLTNHAEPQYRRACEKAGASYFLDKSSDFDEIPRVIAEISARTH
ncbi:MAG TPA: response regulator transcription factor [Usitatibacter sp.]|nr:response regulator transcription factor [Usitatibacter sp.]